MQYAPADAHFSFTLRYGITPPRTGVIGDSVTIGTQDSPTDRQGHVKESRWRFGSGARSVLGAACMATETGSGAAPAAANLGSRLKCVKTLPRHMAFPFGKRQGGCAGCFVSGSGEEESPPMDAENVVDLFAAFALLRPDKF